MTNKKYLVTVKYYINNSGAREYKVEFQSKLAANEYIKYQYATELIKAGDRPRYCRENLMCDIEEIIEKSEK